MIRIKIMHDIKTKLVSRFVYNDRNYSIYKINEKSYNLVSEDETKIKKRFMKFNSMSEIFSFLKIEEQI